MMSRDFTPNTECVNVIFFVPNVSLSSFCVCVSPLLINLECYSHVYAMYGYLYLMHGFDVKIPTEAKEQA